MALIFILHLYLFINPSRFLNSIYRRCNLLFSSFIFTHCRVQFAHFCIFISSLCTLWSLRLSEGIKRMGWHWARTGLGLLNILLALRIVQNRDSILAFLLLLELFNWDWFAHAWCKMSRKSSSAGWCNGFFSERYFRDVRGWYCRAWWVLVSENNIRSFTPISRWSFPYGTMKGN